MSLKPKRGRPSFKSTRANRAMVEQLAAIGETQEAIAAAIGCSAPTLRSNFKDQLTHGASRRRAEVTALLFRAARKGSVPALRYLDAKIAASAEQAPNESTERLKKLGKKALATAEAFDAHKSTPWADLIED